MTESIGEKTSICGWGLATENFCYEPTKPGFWCAEHNARVSPETHCVGCGATPVRDCSGFIGDRRCGKFLCPNCEHQPTGQHSPNQSEVELATEDLESVLALGITRARERGLCAVHEHNLEPLCHLLIQHLSNHTLLKVLSGLATPPQ